MVIRKKKKKQKQAQPEVRINEQISADEVRVLDPDGKNLGIMSFEEALDKAREWNLDLVEISSKADPILVRIVDYGKFVYEKKKKEKEIKAKTNVLETKTVQIKPNTGDGDLNLKAKKISEWLNEGNKVKLDLFLRGRAKYMEKDFLEERLERILVLITTKYNITDGPKKSPKGLTVILELDKKKK